MSRSASPFTVGDDDRRLLSTAPKSMSLVATVGLLLAAMAVAVAFQAAALGTLIAAIVHGRSLDGAALWLFVSSVAALLIVGHLVDVVTARWARRAGDALVEDALAAMASGPTVAPDRVGGLTVALTSGLDGLQGYFGRYLPALLQCAIVPIGLLIWIATLDPIAGAILVVMAGSLPVVMARLGASGAAASAKQWRSLHALSARYFELLDGLTTLRLLNQVDRAEREVAGATASFSTATMAALRIAFRAAVAMEFLSGVAVGLVAMELGFGLLSGHHALATSLTIVLVAAEVFAPLRRVGTEYHAARSAISAANAIADFTSHGEGDPPPLTAHPTLELRDLVVTLSSGDDLPPLSGEVRPGLPLEITGPSGVGKSTTLSTILGLHAARSGSIGLPGASTGAIAAAPQQPFLFATTLAENLRLFRPEATDQDLADATAAVGLTDLIAALPVGLATQVGDGGTSFSAGELRRIGIARVLLADRPVAVLDEPTANLDAAARSAMQTVLEHLARTRCLVVVHHEAAPMFATSTTVHLGGAS